MAAASFIHADDRHAAMISHDLSLARGARRKSPAAFRTWGSKPWTGPLPGEGTLQWAPAMPMAEKKQQIVRTGPLAHVAWPTRVVAAGRVSEAMRVRRARIPQYQ